MILYIFVMLGVFILADVFTYLTVLYSMHSKSTTRLIRLSDYWTMAI